MSDRYIPPLPAEHGLVTRVHTARGNYGMSWVMPVCDLCGAVLADQKIHDEWHERLEVSDDS